MTRHLKKLRNIPNANSLEPPFLVKWGITLLSVIFLFLLFIAWYIKFPEVLLLNGKVLKSGKYLYAKIAIPPNMRGRIKKNQEVLLNFYSHPRDQYGLVRDTIDLVVDSAGLPTYFVVVLSEKPKTTYNRLIDVKPTDLFSVSIIGYDALLLRRFIVEKAPKGALSIFL